MTREQFNEIKERLTKYREIRHLTYENQQARFLGNVLEEVSEYFRAKNDLERIDALCDIAVFCFNAFDFKYTKEIKLNKNYFSCIISDLAYLSKYLIDYLKEKEDIYNLDISNKEKLLKLEGLEIRFKPFFQEHINNIINYIIYISKDLGFDFYKCMIETIKEIESKNIGNYCEYENKFYKMPGAYTLDEAYKLAFYRESNEPSLNGKTKPKLHKENNIMWTFKYKSALGGDMELNFIKWYKADYESCKLQ
ncbi:hypothetical protein L8W41_07015 [Campylobacter sp. IFREMER_LSEM_CL1904]|uniref:hypothetical protein n=1 Tax=Campylobacter sp. IFREMER_LSEM_CL1904 TaxID=2911616 RepID=UPI0021E6423C|nr:hypothetical protein [Campylobacter sp. IFREMER_LSEM_CL1904]MCV3428476.1 hypothetical protein [Campylobacter sp. IFREMER_LSEM_CL1904]